MANIQLVPALGASIAPCVLISGAGLLLLSMTNRLARPIERVRLLCAQIKEDPQKDHQANRQQIRILYKRCELLRSAIACLIYNIVLISCIVLLLFLDILYAWQITFLVDFLFIASLVFLILAMVFFLMDIHGSLDSLKIEIRDST
jgi:hypothetical protein